MRWSCLYAHEEDNCVCMQSPVCLLQASKGLSEAKEVSNRTYTRLFEYGGSQSASWTILLSIRHVRSVNVAIVQVLFQTLEVALDGAQVWHDIWISYYKAAEHGDGNPMYCFKVMCIDVGAGDVSRRAR